MAGSPENPAPATVCWAAVEPVWITVDSLAPEAVQGLTAIDMSNTARQIEIAMEYLGLPFVRDRQRLGSFSYVEGWPPAERLLTLSCCSTGSAIMGSGSEPKVTQTVFGERRRGHGRFEIQNRGKHGENCVRPNHTIVEIKGHSGFVSLKTPLSYSFCSLVSVHRTG